MYKSIKINNFKGFHEFTMDRIGRINLITGVNNVGKTSLLEAMFFHGGAYSPAVAMSIETFRGLGKVFIELGGTNNKTPWDSLFNNFDTSKDIEISGEFADCSARKISLQIVHPSEESSEKLPMLQYGASGSTGPSSQDSFPASPETDIVLRLNYEESPGNKSGSSLLVIGPSGPRTPLLRKAPFPTIFLPARFRVKIEEDVNRFSKLEIEGQQNLLIKALKVMEPRIKRIAVVALGGQPVLYGDIGLSQMLKLPHMGDGMSRLASLILAIGNARNGVVLIDEIENGFHHTMMSKVWEAIDEAANDFNTQIFATTHSLECVISAHKAFSKEGHNDLIVHRLERKNDVVKDIAFNQADLDTAFNLRMDIRGVRRWE